MKKNTKKACKTDVKQIEKLVNFLKITKFAIFVKSKKVNSGPNFPQKHLYSKAGERQIVCQCPNATTHAANSDRMFGRT